MLTAVLCLCAQLKSLKKINLDNCYKLEHFHHDMWILTNLQRLSIKVPSRFHNPKLMFITRNYEPDTRRPKPGTQNSKPEIGTRNPKPETRDSTPETRNPKPETTTFDLSVHVCPRQPQETIHQSYEPLTPEPLNPEP